MLNVFEDLVFSTQDFTYISSVLGLNWSSPLVALIINPILFLFLFWSAFVGLNSLFATFKVLKFNVIL